MHVPRGQRVPDLNRIVRPQSHLPFHRVYSALLLTAAVSTISRVPCETEPRPSDTIERPSRSHPFRGPGGRQRRRECRCWHRQRRGCRVRNRPRVCCNSSAATAEPLSVYDVIPDEDGGTVIPNSPMRQKGPRQLSSPRRPQGKHDSRLLTT